MPACSWIAPASKAFVRGATACGSSRNAQNVAVKISGLAMFDHHWTIESLRPYVLETIDTFGVQRAMFASNFPVDRLFGSYPDIWRAYASIVEDAGDGEKAALFRTNAERIYRI